MESLKQKLTMLVRRPVIAWAGLAILIVMLTGGFYLYQNSHAVSELKAAKTLDAKGNYTAAKKTLGSINTILVRNATKAQIHSETLHNQQLVAVQQKLDTIKQLLKEHKGQAAQDLLKQLTSQPGVAGTIDQHQVANLQQTAKQQTTSATKPSSGASSGTGATSGGGTTQGGGTGGGANSGGGNSGGSGGGSGPNTGPLTSLNVVSITASASAATAATCNVHGSLSFSADGSGDVTVTWSQYSNKTVSQTDNPEHFNFAAAGTQSDSVSFGGSQGLEPGDSYRILATITSVSNPGISVTAGPATISSCAAPPALASEQQSPLMTTITPGTLSVYQAHDGVFSNECSVQVTTPYSVNGAGTVQAIVQITSGSSIGYTYYDSSGATGFTGSGSTANTSYFRLPHLPGGGHYTIQVKLVEVSVPGSVYALTSSVSSNCD